MDIASCIDGDRLCKFTVSRVHGIFGSEKRPLYADGQVEDTKPFNPSQVISEVLSAPGPVLAHCDSSTIGCRIVVDDAVKAERISNEVNAFIHCLVTGA